MFFRFRSVVIVLFCVALCAPVVGQTATSLNFPAWQDPNSTYLAVPPSVIPPNATAVASANGVGAPPKRDSLVTPAVHAQTEDATSTASHRHLAPPTASETVTARSDPGQNGRRMPLSFKLPSNTAYTVASALAMVVGLFLLFAWLLRRGWKGATKSLPADVVSVLGRVPLAAKQYADLLRVGNKLVLVAQTPTGPTTLTEVTDAVEVDRLVGLCQQADPRSTTKAFEQVFRQLAREPVPRGFLGHEASPTSVPQSVDSFGQWRNEAARG